MRWGLACILAALLPIVASAQPEPLVVRSRSDQFVIFGYPSTSSPRALNSLVETTSSGQGHAFWLRPNLFTAVTNSRIHLEPGLVAVSCERIKEALQRELKEKDSTGRRVYIQLNGRIRQENTRIMADRYERGWMYAVEFPVEVDEHFYSATILQVLLYEMANRNSPDQRIDLPRWLVSGLISHLQATTLQSLSLQANSQIGREQNKVDPLVKVRQTFDSELPLTFEELSWPGNLGREREALFRDSAHLFVHQLIQLRGGKESLKSFIYELQRHRNWQFAFLSAFGNNFGQLVEVEKWWGLNFVDFMGRDASQLWSLEESWKQLKAALDVTMHVHLETNRMPVTAEYNLQEAISKWDYARQDMVINKAISQLRVLRFRTHPELRALADSYRTVLEKYLEQRSQLGRSTTKNGQQMNSTILKKAACRQLDALDEHRSKERQNLSKANVSSP